MSQLKSILEQGGDYPKGFEIWIHTISQHDEDCNVDHLPLKRFFETAPIPPVSRALQLEQNRERQRQIEDQKGGLSMSTMRELDVLIREERNLIREERLAAEGHDQSDVPHPVREGSFKWFHIPANHMDWVESFFATYNGGIFHLDDSLWTKMLRPEFSRNTTTPVHATHMLPSFHPKSMDVPSDQPLFTLYLPYMNWETYNRYCSLFELYNAGIRWPTELDYRDNGPNFDPRLTHVQRDMRKLHPRRTLDQFAYPFLPNTIARDADQTVSKWTSNINKYEEVRKPDATSRLIMVDQLWCWIVDDGTVLTCFPSHNAQYSDPEFTDLYGCIREELGHCNSAWSLCELIVSQAVTHLITPRNQKFLDPIGIYQQAMSTKTVDQITLFQEFQQSSAEGTPSFDDRQELALVQDVADMNDELKMIYDLMIKQRQILASMEKTHQEPQRKRRLIGVDMVLAPILEHVHYMRSEADRNHALLLQLLDLKQKSATLSEARSTAQQGRAVMLFTIVTVIFLPLSFFTSYFGQNVSEITGDDKNPSTWDLWKICLSA
ncbi:hypothetical protein K505DRAFT_130542 [Melanomma pulvis-pyrius CBS 109.77]|uniref:Cora-domain-containing protein n=1 Tax=Melanomma pulvis-pyrius CBS 109.77 TaxID=1314802 RepID=A0A6A6WTJ5_9PLEO|nr:hypothetical protein K505DRAFT_130542 [Melanomma pulvis-pyrius CBS 109.77]